MEKKMTKNKQKIVKIAKMTKSEKEWQKMDEKKWKGVKKMKRPENKLGGNKR